MDQSEKRRKMIEEQILSRGVYEAPVIEALLKVPREEFVPDNLKHLAYEDRALPIGEDQTISQPFIVALMIKAVLPENPKTKKVLEVGTGSGYSAAVLSLIFSHVYTVERKPSLLQKAKEMNAKLGYKNISYVGGDGSRGLKEFAPFNAIIVHAAGKKVPPVLTGQLAPGAKLILPLVLEDQSQHLVQITKTASGIKKGDLGGVVFVPLVTDES